MTNMRCIQLRNARKQRGLTQEDVAQVLGISRPTYTKIEEGDKDITIHQADLLKVHFGIDLLASAQADETAIKKFRDMMLAVIHFAGADGDGRIPKTKLAKLLYFCDAQWFLDYAQPMSSMVYRKLPQGPVPYEFFQSVDQMADNGTISIKFSGLAQMIGAAEPFSAANSRLSKEEICLIERVCSKWKARRTDAIVAQSHDHPTWQQAVDYAPINMSLLKQYKGLIY